MESRPLPILDIAKALLTLGIVSLFAQFFSLRWLHGIGLLIAFLSITGMLCYHAWVDNLRATYRNFHLYSILGTTIVVWLPFLFLLAPGIWITLYIDDKLDAGLRYAEKSVAGKIETINTLVAENIEETEKVADRWWWPPDWFKSSVAILKNKSMRAVQKDVLTPAPIWVRAFFSVIYALLRVSQLILYSTLALIAIRSFLFLLARSALWYRSEIEFSLP